MTPQEELQKMIEKENENLKGWIQTKDYALLRISEVEKRISDLTTLKTKYDQNDEARKTVNEFFNALQ